jgi:hypothetical protein
MPNGSKLLRWIAGFVVTSALLGLPSSASAACQVCSFMIRCNPDCETIDICKDAPLFKGFDDCVASWYGCSTQTPCQWASLPVTWPMETDSAVQACLVSDGFDFRVR